MMTSGFEVCTTASKQRQHFLQSRQLLLVDQNVRVFHLDPHLVGVGDEIGGDVTAIELHPFDHFQFGLQRLRLLDRDHALIADLLHGVGKKAPNLGIAVRGDGADLGDLLVRGDLLGVLLQVQDDRLNGEVDAALEVHRVHPGGNSLCALPDDRVSEDRGGRRAITRGIGCLGCDLAHHLCAHILELVLKLDLLGDRHPVLGDARRAVGFVEHDVAAFGTERYPDRVGESVDAAQHPVACVDRKSNFLGRHFSNSSKETLC